MQALIHVMGGGVLMCVCVCGGGGYSCGSQVQKSRQPKARVGRAVSVMGSAKVGPQALGGCLPGGPGGRGRGGGDNWTSVWHSPV